LAFRGSSATWWVATNGLDSNTGASNSPFATIMRAQTAASAGDTVNLRGGTYFLNNTNFTATNAPWAIVNNINKSGISYLAYPGELPVFDFSQTDPGSNRETAFLVTASSCVFKGFDVVGVQVTIQTNHTQSENFRIAGGNFNRFEQLRMHDGMGNGWYLTSGASNLVINCDAWNNRGLDSGSLGNTDGFGCHPNKTNQTGNILMGCRAWFNSDDGYDCIRSYAKVTFSNCWAFDNGYFTNGASSTGDGNGVKGGGYGLNGTNTPGGTVLPVPVPRHLIEFCVAVHNRANGIYANHHVGGCDWFNNTAYRNGSDFDMQGALDDNLTDVPGYGHVMKNNLGFKAPTALGTSNDVTFNYFTLPVTVDSNDFVTMDESLLAAPRQADGSLPYIAFLQLAGSSDLVDAGTNIGFAYAGTAPDLGAFERGLHTPPLLAMTLQGPNQIFNVSNGWAGGTNYLLSSTNLALPMGQWTFIGTNTFDLTGNCVITNSFDSGTAQGFYRISLP
jgi:pectate lyase